jgi:hypothetical protein
MARAMVKTSNLNRATPTAEAAASRARAYDHDLDDWPRSWMGWEKDLPPGEELVACFRPFIAQLASSELAPKTIRRHVDNLWLLGGRLISDLNETPRLRQRSIRQVPWEAIDDEGGPLIHGGMDEQAQRSFDATCRKLRRFLRPTS